MSNWIFSLKTVSNLLKVGIDHWMNLYSMRGYVDQEAWKLLWSFPINLDMRRLNLWSREAWKESFNEQRMNSFSIWFFSFFLFLPNNLELRIDEVLRHFSFIGREELNLDVHSQKIPTIQQGSPWAVSSVWNPRQALTGFNLTFLVKSARVWPNAEVARFTLLYRQNFMRVCRPSWGILFLGE